MPSWIGLPELLILLVIVLLIFGPKKLPEMGRSLGRGMREFKDSISGNDRDDDVERPQIEQPTATAPQPPDAQPQADAQPQPTQPQTQPESERVSS